MCSKPYNRNRALYTVLSNQSTVTVREQCSGFLWSRARASPSRTSTSGRFYRAICWELAYFVPDVVLWLLVVLTIWLRSSMGPELLCCLLAGECFRCRVGQKSRGRFQGL